MKKANKQFIFHIKHILSVKTAERVMAEIFCGRTAQFPAATELLASKSLPPLIVSIQYIPTAFMGGLQIKVVVVQLRVNTY